MPKHDAVPAVADDMPDARLPVTRAEALAIASAGGVHPVFTELGEDAGRMLQILHACRATRDLQDVDDKLRVLVRDVAYELLLVGSSARAPRDKLVFAREVVRAWRTRGNAQPWQRILAALLDARALFPKNSKRAVVAILSKLAASVVDADEIPAPLREPDTTALESAAAAFEGISSRIARGRPPKARKGEITPWRAAVEFASYFGVRMPAKESIAGRTRRKS
jgi:hypothetical protein